MLRSSPADAIVILGHPGSYVLQFAHVPVAEATVHLARPAVRLGEKLLRIGLG